MAVKKYARNILHSIRDVFLASQRLYKMTARNQYACTLSSSIKEPLFRASHHRVFLSHVATPSQNPVYSLKLRLGPGAASPTAGIVGLDLHIYQCLSVGSVKYILVVF